MNEHPIQSPEALEAQEELANEKRVRDAHNENALAAQRAEVRNLHSKANLRNALAWLVTMAWLLAGLWLVLEVIA